MNEKNNRPDEPVHPLLEKVKEREAYQKEQFEKKKQEMSTLMALLTESKSEQTGSQPLKIRFNEKLLKLVEENYKCMANYLRTLHSEVDHHLSQFEQIKKAES